MTTVSTNYGHMDRDVEVTIELHTSGKRICAQATFHEKGSIFRTAFVPRTLQPQMEEFIEATAEFIIDNNFNFEDDQGDTQWYRRTINPNAPTLKSFTG